ncbi:hypothetical protein JZ751_007809 [Albula glossodonta]|uniref:Uncharacterized protein n=1 Tax=Albula glossodonta TaxID=121402 RepID=A0A8T2P0N2_9TELE|nr:hypothetical protein JZ751_007809 [Albula glossodonta]
MQWGSQGGAFSCSTVRNQPPSGKQSETAEDGADFAPLSPFKSECPSLIKLYSITDTGRRATQAAAIVLIFIEMSGEDDDVMSQNKGDIIQRHWDGVESGIKAAWDIPKLMEELASFTFTSAVPNFKCANMSRLSSTPPMSSGLTKRPCGSSISLLGERSPEHHAQPLLPEHTQQGSKGQALTANNGECRGATAIQTFQQTYVPVVPPCRVTTSQACASPSTLLLTADRQCSLCELSYCLL